MTRQIGKAAFVLALVCGCQSEAQHDRNWLFRGEWIAIDGWGREADEACAGTFEYFDAWSGMLAAEFGIEQHLGVYRWSSWDHYSAGDLPCTRGTACAESGEAYSPLIPDEHEVVHLANYRTGLCPSVLAEGLAVYYGGMRGGGSASADLDLLSNRLAAPSVKIPFEEYAIAGRFAAFLVHEFGLDAVLEICSTTGNRPDAAALSSAMQDILGASPGELVEQLAGEPAACNEFDRFRSRLYACGEEPLAAHAGIVHPESEFVATYSLGCEHEASIGSVEGEVRRILQIEFAEADVYRIHVEYLDDAYTPPPVTTALASCVYCGSVEEFQADFGGHDLELEPGRYWLELRAPPDFADTIQLRIQPRPW
jgi:hypothetical protein